MKKNIVLAAALSIAFALSLAGCDDKQERKPASSETAVRATELTGACIKAYELALEENNLIFAATDGPLVIGVNHDETQALFKEAIKETLLYYSEADCAEEAAILEKSIASLNAAK